MHPFQLENEILVLLLSSQDAGGNPGADDHPIAHRPGFWRAVDVEPAVEILAVEERAKAFILFLSKGPITHQQAADQQYAKFHITHS
jgi:hypothetical protein